MIVQVRAVQRQSHVITRDRYRRAGPHYPYQNTRPRDSRDRDFLAWGPSSRT